MLDLLRACDVGALALLALVAGCGDEATAPPDGDVAVSTEVASTDVPDGDAGELPSADAIGPTDSPPVFDAPSPITLAMGRTTTLPLGPLVHDAEDAHASLVVTWQALHVALADHLEGGLHVLTIIAPVDWSGTEVIPLTVTDSAGNVAGQTLSVIVEPPDDPTPTEPGCPIDFRFAAPSGARSVLLSGSFNGWGSSPATATPMADADGDGTWAATVRLEPGSWLYKFIVDGVWVADPANPETLPDGYGGVNSVLDVTCPSEAP